MIERRDMEKLAALSRIAVSEDELLGIGGEISKILEYVSEIQNVAAAEEAAEVGAVHNIMRDDEHPLEGGVSTDALLAAVPSREGKYVRVKKIL